MSDPYNEFAVFERARVIAGRLFIFVYLVRTCCEMTSTARSITVHFHVEGSLPRHRILGTHSIAASMVFLPTAAIRSQLNMDSFSTYVEIHKSPDKSRFY